MSTTWLLTSELVSLTVTGVAAVGAILSRRTVHREADHGDDDLMRSLRASVLAGRPAEDLTEREYEVASLVAKGRTNREIGQSLSLSQEGVELYVRDIFRKLDALRFVEQAQRATRERGIIREEETR